MFKSKLLIVAEQSVVFKPYELILKNFFETITTLHIDDFETFQNIEINHFDILLIDLYSKKYIDSIKTIPNIESQDIKILLISPFNLAHIPKSINNLVFIHLILTKPIEITKLKTFIENETKKIEKSNLLERKNHVLAKVVDLHPSKIGIFALDGLLFYANDNYLLANNLTLKHIDTLHFDKISQCNIGFESIAQKLQITKSFTHQREEDSTWHESIFYIINYEFIIHICTDITQAKQKEIQLEQSAVFYENSNEGIIITDDKGKIISVNKSFCKITGYTKDEAIGKTPQLLNSGMHDKNFYENMWDSLKNNGSWQGEIWNKRKNGEIYPEWLSIAKAVNPKYNEEFFIAIFTDITTLKEADKKLHFYANHDVLTGLANRVQFDSHLKNSIQSCKRNETQLALFFIDLDKFKDINDTYGHSVGDEMLKTVAKRFEQTLRQEDFIARLGGDEFVLIVKDVKQKSDMELLANKIMEYIKEPITIEEKVFFMSLSVGIALYPEHGVDTEELTKHADAAMYEVKEDGRNGFKIYNQDMSHKVSNKLIVQNELEISIKKDEFEMYYQAIVDVKTDKIIGAEALVRWNHTQKGVLSPFHFIDIIEDSRMNIEFGELVFKKVLSDMQTINSFFKNHNFKISINISAKHFFEHTFIPAIVGFCKDFSIEPTQIELELLETHIMKNSSVSQKKLEKLHELGFKVAIDDFGTGYSSLSYLKNFTVDKLKIDQSFIRDFLEDKSDKAIVEAIIKLSETFDMKVQAEGVETKEHLALLKTMRCDLAQGYYYNIPIPLNEFLTFTQKENSEK
jgi:diguanylate cyclase (GGDEF)-like protein/PAS domain S-box-containing protein